MPASHPALAFDLPQRPKDMRPSHWAEPSLRPPGEGNPSPKSLLAGFIALSWSAFAEADMTGMSMPMDSDGRGKQLADTVCAACHGPAGVSVADEIPNLAGQMPMYTAQALVAYRDKSRTSAMMNPVAAGLSDADIQAVAHHYAHLKSAGQAD